MRREPLDELPSDGSTANAKVVVESNEDVLRDIDIFVGTLHALVTDSRVGGATVGLQLDLLVAEGVGVGRSAHLEVGEGENARLARVVLAAGAEASREMGDLAGEGARGHVLAVLKVVVGLLGREGSLANAVMNAVSMLEWMKGP